MTAMKVSTVSHFQNHLEGLVNMHIPLPYVTLPKSECLGWDPEILLNNPGQYFYILKFENQNSNLRNNMNQLLKLVFSCFPYI
jgi:hypothetical protein